MKSSTHKFLWWVSHRQEAFLNFALMGLVSLPTIVWAIIFLLVIIMGHGQALMRLAAPPLWRDCAVAHVRALPPIYVYRLAWITARLSATTSSAAPFSASSINLA